MKNDKQMLELLTRMSELAKEILNKINNEDVNRDAIIDECAKVEALLTELKKNYNIEAEVKEKTATILKIVKKTA